MRLVRFILFTISLISLVAAAQAQAVRWELSEGGLPNTVVLVFENCEPEGQPELPVIPGVTFTSLGRSESSQSTFGAGGFTTIRTIALSYMIRGRQNAPEIIRVHEIPPQSPARSHSSRQTAAGLIAGRRFLEGWRAFVASLLQKTTSPSGGSVLKRPPCGHHVATAAEVRAPATYHAIVIA